MKARKTPQPTRNKPRARKRLRPRLVCFQSSLTTGSRILHEVDGRSAWMRRFRDLIDAHQSDLGGREFLSEGQQALLRRAALLQLQLEMMEQKFALRDDGVATYAEIEVYQRASGALRRLVESLGLNEGRKARNVTPSSNKELNHFIDGVVARHRGQVRLEI